MNQSLQAPSPQCLKAAPRILIFLRENPGINENNFHTFSLREWWEAIASGTVRGCRVTPGAWGGEDAPRPEGCPRPSMERGDGEAPPGVGTLLTAPGFDQARESPARP